MKTLEIALLAVTTFGPAVALAAPTIKTVALQNEQSPETSFFYKKFEKPAVSDAAGQRVAVFARLAGKKCIFSLDPDSNADSTVACRRDPTPDGHVFTKLGQKLGDESINTSSTTAFAARLSSGRGGVFRSGPAFVANIGDPVPAPGTGLLKAFSYARISDAGDVVFEATISGGAVVLGTEVNAGLFRCTGGNGNCSAATGGTGTLSTLVLVNDAVPDRPGRKFCKLFALDGSTYGIAFRAETQLDCASTIEVPLDGIFRRTVAGTLVTVALEGEASNPFPSPGGTTYLRLDGPPTIANTGMVAFQGTTTGNLTNNVLYVCDPATCPLAPADDAITQGNFDDDGNVFRTFSGPAVSDVGDIAFSGKAEGALGALDGLWVRRRLTSDTETIALPGDPVPGSNPAAVFYQLFAPSMSGGGKVAFGGRIARAVAPRKLRGVFIFESPSGAFLDEEGL
ncbi:MAG TPA: hypothetical protein VKA21_06030 [Candidatus Binatia bacterium]|nr:hypothetical protein [Candidatus Binatia bacterium]